MDLSSTRLRKCGSNHSVNLLDKSSMFRDRAALQIVAPFEPGYGRTCSADHHERIMRQFRYGAVGLWINCCSDMGHLTPVRMNVVSLEADPVDTRITIC